MYSSGMIWGKYVLQRFVIEVFFECLCLAKNSSSEVVFRKKHGYRMSYNGWSLRFPFGNFGRFIKTKVETMDNFADRLGSILWFSMFLTPLVTIPLAWKYSKQKRVVRILIGLFYAFIISFLLYFISLAILFRNGMGPG
jgi:hypothetical protein